jgi:hypothetical protein
MPLTEPATDSLGDELLRWASEQGSGTRESLLEATAHLAEKHQLRTGLATTFADQLSSLGHLDIDWDNGRWSVAPPTLNLIPGLGLLAVLTGARTYHLKKEFERASALRTEFFELELTQPNLFGGNGAPVGPRAIFVKCASTSDAEGLAARAHLELAIDPAASLAIRMPSLDEARGSRAAPAVRDRAQWFDPTVRQWDDMPDDCPSGLYQQDLHARPDYLWHDHDQGDAWWRIGLAEGQFKAIQGSAVVRWTRGSPNNGVASRFEVQLGPPQSGVLPTFGHHLPTLAERALTVSDGFLPVIYEAQGERWKRYKNVSEDVARTIANKLGQSM